MSFVSIVFWLPFLLFTQPEQQLRWKSEQLLGQGKFANFGQLVAGHDRDDFPPHWDPPPRVGYRETEPDPRLVLHGLLDAKSASWVVEAYLEKILFNNNFIGNRADLTDRHRDISDDQLEELLEVLEQIDGGSKLASRLCKSDLLSVENPPPTFRRRILLERLESISNANESLVSTDASP